MNENESSLIQSIVERLQEVPGIQAVVLGGSRARGTHTPSSDIDLGLYYNPSTGFDLDELTRVAAEIDDQHRPDLVTGIGGWGPWINGGGWLTVQSIAVDFIYRDLDRVAQVIADCREGKIEVAYQPGHPHGFMSYIYYAETAVCQPLWDPHGWIARLKEQTQSYPPKLKQAILDRFAWEADFSLQIAGKSISRGDVSYAAGCCFRCVACLAQSLFALNEQPWLNEKGSVAAAAAFPIYPPRLQERVASAFDQLNSTPPGIQAAIQTLKELQMEVCALLER